MPHESRIRSCDGPWARAIGLGHTPSAVSACVSHVWACGSSAAHSRSSLNGNGILQPSPMAQHQGTYRARSIEQHAARSALHVPICPPCVTQLLNWHAACARRLQILHAARCTRHAARAHLLTSQRPPANLARCTCMWHAARCTLHASRSMQHAACGGPDVHELTQAGVHVHGVLDGIWK